MCVHAGHYGAESVLTHPFGVVGRHGLVLRRIPGRSDASKVSGQYKYPRRPTLPASSNPHNVQSQAHFRRPPPLSRRCFFSRPGCTSIHPLSLSIVSCSHLPNTRSTKITVAVYDTPSSPSRSCHAHSFRTPGQQGLPSRCTTLLPLPQIMSCSQLLDTRSTKTTDSLIAHGLVSPPLSSLCSTQPSSPSPARTRPHMPPFQRSSIEFLCVNL